MKDFPVSKLISNHGEVKDYLSQLASSNEVSEQSIMLANKFANSLIDKGIMPKSISIDSGSGKVNEKFGIIIEMPVKKLGNNYLDGFVHFTASGKIIRGINCNLMFNNSDDAVSNIVNTWTQFSNKYKA